MDEVKLKKKKKKQGPKGNEGNQGSKTYQSNLLKIETITNKLLWIILFEKL